MAVYKDARRGNIWRYRKRIRLPDGRRRRIEGTPPVDTKAAAEHAERLHVLRLTAPGAIAPSEPKQSTGECPTFGQYSSTFISSYKPGQKPSARRSKEQIVNAHLKPLLGHKRLDLTKFPVLFLRAFPSPYMIIYRDRTPLEIVGALHGSRSIKRLLRKRGE